MVFRPYQQSAMQSKYILNIFIINFIDSRSLASRYCEKIINEKAMKDAAKFLKM